MITNHMYNMIDLALKYLRECEPSQFNSHSDYIQYISDMTEMVEELSEMINEMNRHIDELGSLHYRYRVFQKRLVPPTEFKFEF